MTKSLDGKVVLLTGAAGGLGRAMAHGLIEAGAKVMAADVNEAGLATVAAGIASDRLSTCRLDISDRAQCEAVVAATLRQCGGLDILINNGALGMGAIRDDHFVNLVEIDDVEPKQWDRFVAVNLSGPWYLTKAAVGVMKGRKAGQIINITTSFFTMLRGRFHPYGPVKAGFEAMSAGHAEEFAPYGITVNVVVPGGPADTPMVPHSSGWDRATLVPPEAMLGPILWLTSGAGAGVTGKRYVAANWKSGQSIAQNREAAEAPIGWPGLAAAPVWPGGRPQS